jgi:hypothetical protein
VSTGDPIKVPLSSSRPVVVRQEALVLGESVEEMPEEGSAQEAPATQVQEVPTTKAEDGSGAPLLQGMPAWVEVAVTPHVTFPLITLIRGLIMHQVLWLIKL